MSPDTASLANYFRAQQQCNARNEELWAMAIDIVAAHRDRRNRSADLDAAIERLAAWLEADPYDPRP